MEEFIEELKYNQKIKGTQTVRIDYVIERLEEIMENNNEEESITSCKNKNE